MSLPKGFGPLSPPTSLLGYHRQLSPSAAVKVSPVCLGAMGFGTKWKDWMGECDEEQSFELLDFFYSQGGNFIDTANNYQQGDSERIIGKWMKERGNRSEIVLATKYGSAWRSHQEREIIQSNFGGLNIKALKHSVEDSLTKLQTDYIDVLYVHWWDHSVGIPELMHALNDLVVKGKVLYLGVSNTPAWIVVKCNAYAEAHNLRQFSIFQGRWNASQREFERDIIPMARSEGMALAPWGVFGQGIFKTKDQKEASQAEGGRQPFVGATKDDEMVTEKLEEMAKRKRVSLQAVALAYVWHKTPYVFPVVGGRKVEHMKSNIEALGAHLSREEIDEIDMATGKPYDLGYPHTVVAMPKKKDVAGDLSANDNIGNIIFWTGDEVSRPQPIQNGLH